MAKERVGAQEKGIFVAGEAQQKKGASKVIERYRDLEKKSLGDSKIGSSREKNAEAVEKMYNSDKLDNFEKSNLNEYTGWWASNINSKIREGETLSSLEKARTAKLDSALDKLPKHAQLFFRALNFGSTAKKQSFMDKHKVGNIVRYDAYTSASRSRGPFGFEGSQVQLYIDGKAPVVEKISQHTSEREAIFGRNSTFRVDAVNTKPGGQVEVFVKQVKV